MIHRPTSQKENFINALLFLIKEFEDKTGVEIEEINIVRELISDTNKHYNMIPTNAIELKMG